MAIHGLAVNDTIGNCNSEFEFSKDLPGTTLRTFTVTKKLNWSTPDCGNICDVVVLLLMHHTSFSIIIGVSICVLEWDEFDS